MKLRIFSVTLIFILSIFLLNFQSVNAQRYWNVAAKCNGTNYIAVGQWSSLQNLSGSFTVECWVNCETGGTGTVFGKTGIRLILDPLTSTTFKARLQTNNNTKFYSRTAVPMQINRWYHVACTYDSTGTGSMKFYINGTLDTSRTGTNLGPLPGTASDSLLIGRSVSYGSLKGLVDDIRIWDRPLSQAEIQANMRNPYVGAINTDHPNFGTGLLMSSSFDFTYAGSGSIYFYDGYNNYNNINVPGANIAINPSLTLATNNSIQLNGTSDYARMTQNNDINLTGPVTVEAWIHPINSVGASSQYIIKKGSDYYMYLNTSGKLAFGFHAVGTSTFVIPSNQWTHAAATCTATGLATLYINGVQNSSGNAGSQPTPGTDTLYIGSSSSSSSFFNGNIDAVKISNFVKTPEEIKNGMFKLIEFDNKPSPPNTTVSLNFDYHNYSSTSIGGHYYFMGGAKYSSAGIIDNVPVSPLLGLNIQSFPNGYILKYSGRRIPDAATAGYMQVDSLYVPTSASVTDIKLFIALNHTKHNDLQIKLVSPNGDSLIVFDQNYALNTNSDHIITVFDDAADSSLVNGRYVSFDPRIKPVNPLNSFFANHTTQGYWRLKILDYNNGNTGILYGWGVRINNSIGIKQISSEIPDNFILQQNYPNPFNPTTNIRYEISENRFVKLTIYDILGKEIEKLINEKQAPGIYEVTFNASQYPSGVYFYRIEAEDFTDVKKMIFLK